ncbi:hypothetical protein AYI70_g8499 [Smittium culicis]|uniref:Uncharacterized protein n=1 Tax=Smittium culicis TaxID=133412 RepID=A0A1R1XFN1_9FUNG|nr:hypothetical protein AYI70_g8499 [Smittium culicis]
MKSDFDNNYSFSDPNHENDISGLKLKLDDSNNDRKYLEIQLSEAENEKNKLLQDFSELSKQSKKLEKALAKERENAEKERSLWLEREKKLSTDLEKAQSNSPIQRRNTVSISNNKNHPDFSNYPGSYLNIAPTSRLNSSKRGSVYSKDSFNDSYLFEKSTNNLNIHSSTSSPSDIESLLIELNETKRRLSESEKKNLSLKRQVKILESNSEISNNEIEKSREKIKSLEIELSQQQSLIDTLRDDNESFQTLLHMQSITGKYKMGTIGDSLLKDSDSINIDSDKNSLSALKIDSKRNSSESISNIEDQDKLDVLDISSPINTSLATELNSSFHNSSEMSSVVADLKNKVFSLKEETRVLKAERNKLIDEGKATALYINRILTGVLSLQGGLEAVLDKDFNLPNPESSNPSQPLNALSRSKTAVEYSKPIIKPRSDSIHASENHTISSAMKESQSEFTPSSDFGSFAGTNSSPPNSHANSHYTNSNSNSNFSSNPIYSILSSVGNLKLSSSSASHNSNPQKENSTSSTREDQSFISTLSSRPVKQHANDQINHNSTRANQFPEIPKSQTSRPRAQTLYSNSNWWNRLSVKFTPDKSFAP